MKIVPRIRVIYRTKKAIPEVKLLLDSLLDHRRTSFPLIIIHMISYAGFYECKRDMALLFGVKPEELEG